MKQSKVSVIVPVYNVEKYLMNCAKSILGQTYENLEIILVDDGSTDSSGELCDQLKALDSRIVVIHQKNGGLSDARNSGINIATGKYYAFVDSDDFIASEMIERLVEAIDKTNCEIAQCKFFRCDESDMIENVPKMTNDNSIVEYREDRMEQYLKYNNISTTAWAKLYWSKLFDEIRYPYGKYHEDVFTTYKLIDLANGVAVIGYNGYIYRHSSNSITTEGFSKKRLDAIEGKINMAKYIEAEYPHLKNNAYIEVIYACNINLIEMVHAGYQDKTVNQYLQFVYRKYGRSYLLSNKSIKKKLFVLLAMLDIAIIRGIVKKMV